MISMIPFLKLYMLKFLRDIMKLVMIEVTKNAPAGFRSLDLEIKSLSLYQLSHAGSYVDEKAQMLSAFNLQSGLKWSKNLL